MRAEEMTLTAWLAVAIMGSLTGTAKGGSCWQQMSAAGRCHGQLAANITREECCQMLRGRQTFWVEQNLDSGRLFYYSYVGGGMPGCMPCHGNCDSFQCGGNERCRMRGGQPRCMCSPNCSAIVENRSGQLGSHKGAICGTDGRTYRSHCALLRNNCKQRLQVEVSYLGECQAQTCANVVCTRDGEHCVVDQHNIPHCIQCPRNCPTVGVSPVCGSDERTYRGGVCAIAQHNCRTSAAIFKQYDGACQENSTCNKINCNEQPNSKCLFDKLSNKRICMRCPPDCDPSTADPLPVCGTNGVTYSNWCEMRLAACKTGLNLQTKHAGRCNADENSIRMLIRDYYQREESLIMEYGSSEEETRHKKRGTKRRPLL